ncbi:MAG: hypothetical protein ACRD2B_10810 [Terriglobia bacterium]
MKQRGSSGRGARSASPCGWRILLLFPALFVFSATISAQSTAAEIPLTIAKDVPLHVILTHRVPINKKPGEPVVGRLAAPVYVYNEVVLPAGCEMLGRIVRIQGVPRWRRAQAIMAGNFTPLRTAGVEFDTLVLKNGRQLPISTAVMPGAAPMVRLESGGGKVGSTKGVAAGAIREARREASARKKRALASLRAPNKLHRAAAWLKALAVSKAPYHHQAFQPGTVFTAVLERPLQLGVERLPEAKLDHVGSPPPPDSVLYARLLQPLSSATAHSGDSVTALVTRPLFSARHELIIPQGSRLEGTVVRVKPARRLDRNGNLRFTFQRIEPPAAEPRIIHASLQGIEVPQKANLTVTAEGGVKPAASKGKYLIPALSVALAVWTNTPDRDADTQPGAPVPGQGGAMGQTLAGGWGLGWVGTVASLTANSRVLTSMFGFYGAAWSIYSHLLARGHDVVFPANTSMEIRLGTHDRRNTRLKLPGSQPRGRQPIQ